MWITVGNLQKNHFDFYSIATDSLVIFYLPVNFISPLRGDDVSVQRSFFPHEAKRSETSEGCFCEGSNQKISSFPAQRNGTHPSLNSPGFAVSFERVPSRRGDFYTLKTFLNLPLLIKLIIHTFSQETPSEFHNPHSAVLISLAVQSLFSGGRGFPPLGRSLPLPHRGIWRGVL